MPTIFRGAKPDPVASVTSLPESPEAERKRRMQQYVVAMSIRTACVILAVVLPSPWLWLAATGAIFLPYFAVVLANREPSFAKENVANTTQSVES
jgi:predicted tellurium resistance membrane protein TerC